MAMSIYNAQGRELGISRRDVETVELAGAPHGQAAVRQTWAPRGLESVAMASYGGLIMYT